MGIGKQERIKAEGLAALTRGTAMGTKMW